MIAAADGCRAGWIVPLEHTRTRPLSLGRRGEITCLVTDDLGHILAQNPDVFTIDIPIGIPSTGQRAADREARGLLKPRGSCVFPTPVRATFDALSYEHACDLHRQCDGRALSKQAYMILDKIKQVDSLVCTHPNGAAIYEIHPEVSFAAMNGLRPLVQPKRTPEGKAVRKALVAGEFGADAYESVRHRHRTRDVADDDILDAFAALWSARRIATGEHSRVPPEPALDELGVRMHIHY